MMQGDEEVFALVAPLAKPQDKTIAPINPE